MSCQLCDFNREINQALSFSLTGGFIYCLIDSQAVATADRMVQWRQALAPGLQVIARNKSRLPGVAGTVDVGKKQNWLYSLKRYPNADDLKAKIDQMIDSALRS